MTILNLEFLQSELERVSDWIKFSDQKAAFISAFYTLFLGVLVDNREAVFKGFAVYHGYMHFVFSLLLLSLVVAWIIGIVYIVYSVFPRLRISLSKKQNLFYFGDVAKMESLEYIESMNTADEQGCQKMILQQIHTNAVIASQKFTSVKKATLILFCILIAGAIFGALLPKLSEKDISKYEVSIQQ